jgi:hypothetical protein
MGGYPVVVFLTGVGLSGRNCYPGAFPRLPPRHTTVLGRVVVCYGGPEWFRPGGVYCCNGFDGASYAASNERCYRGRLRALTVYELRSAL